MNSKSSETHRLFGPDLIRATAILLVLLSHTLPGMSTFAIIGRIRSDLGFLGVEIFFVLSGYLIGGILLKQLAAGGLDTLAGVSVFWKRRWFRTLPNYYLFLLLFLFLAWRVEGSLPAGFWNFFWFGQALASPHPGFFTVAWSLAVEEWFYFSFPMILWSLLKLSRSRNVALWVTIGLFLLFPPILRGFCVADDLDAGLRKVTLFRLDAILFGVVLAFVRERRMDWWSGLRRCWPIGLAGILVLSISRVTGTPSFFGKVVCFDLVSFSLVLLFPRVVEISSPKNLHALIIEKISLWSYSMYLSHSWVGEGLIAIFVSANWSIHGANALLISCLIWTLTLAISAALYSLFEKPLMDLRDRPVRAVT